MSFLAGLLSRELPAALPGAAPQAGTTPAAPVVPRLASRFENPGTALPAGTLYGGAGGRGDPGLERLEEHEAAPDAWADGGTGDGGIPAAGSHPRPATGPGREPRADAAPAPGTGGPRMGREPSALHPVPAKGDRRTGTETRSWGPAAAAHPSTTPAVPAAPSAAALLVPATPSHGAVFSPAAPEGGDGHPGRASGVVQGMELAGENHSPGGRPPGDGWPAGREAEGAVRPRLEPLARREPARAPERHIHVSIGRIEVRAGAAQAPARPAPVQPGLMSLDDYLRDRP